jgi:hypothetical protein
MVLVSQDSILLVASFAADHARQNLAGFRTMLDEAGADLDLPAKKQPAGFPYTHGDLSRIARSGVSYQSWFGSGVVIDSLEHFEDLVDGLRSGEILRTLRTFEYDGRQRMLVVWVGSFKLPPLSEWCVGFERKVLACQIADIGVPRMVFTDLYDPEGRIDLAFGGCRLGDTHIIVGFRSDGAHVVVEPVEVPTSVSATDGEPKTLDETNLCVPDVSVRRKMECLTVRMWSFCGEKDEGRAKRLFGDVVHQNLRTIVLTNVHAHRTDGPGVDNILSPGYVGFILSHPEQFPVLENLSVQAKHGPSTINIRSRTLRRIQLPESAELATIDCPRLELISQALSTAVELADGTDPATIELYASGKRGYAELFKNAIKSARHLIIGPDVGEIRSVISSTRREQVRVDSNKLKSIDDRADARSEPGNFRFAAPNLEEMWIGGRRLVPSAEIG